MTTIAPSVEKKCLVFTSEVQSTNKREYALVGKKLGMLYMSCHLPICSLCINETPDSLDSFRSQAPSLELSNRAAECGDKYEVYTIFLTQDCSSAITFDTSGC